MPTTDTAQIRLASPLKRVLAFLFDLVFFALFLRFSLIPITAPQHWDIAQDIGAHYYLYFYPAWFACMLLRDSIGGASLGRRFLNIRVCCVQENTPNPKISALALRNLWLLLPSEIYFLLFDRKGRRMGDKQCGTAVIQSLADFGIRNFSSRILGVFLVVAVLWSSYVFSAGIQIKKSYLYQLGVQEVGQSRAVYERLGEVKNIDGPQMFFEEGYYVIALKVQGSRGADTVSLYYSPLAADQGYSSGYTFSRLAFADKQ